MPPTTRKKRVTKNQASQLVKSKQQSPPLTLRLNFLASVLSTRKLQASTVAKTQTEAPIKQSALLNPTHVVGSGQRIRHAGIAA